MLIVDTNVLVDVLEDDPDWAEWSIGQLRAQAQVHELVINPIIYAELSLAFATVEALDYDLADDIGEKNDLAQKEPAKFKELTAAWDKWNSELVDPKWYPDRGGAAGKAGKGKGGLRKLGSAGAGAAAESDGRHARHPARLHQCALLRRRRSKAVREARHKEHWLLDSAGRPAVPEHADLHRGASQPRRRQEVLGRVS